MGCFSAGEMSCCSEGGSVGEVREALPPKLTNKIILVGDYGVGKTSLVQRYINGDVPREVESTPMFGYYEVVMDGVTCQIWDTAGSEKYGSMMPMYLRGADIVMVCFDLSGENAVKGVIGWIGIVSTYSPAVRILVVGTKADLCIASSGVAEKMTAELAPYELGSQSLSICHVCCATSATTGQGVKELFEHVKEHLASVVDQR